MKDAVKNNKEVAKSKNISFRMACYVNALVKIWRTYQEAGITLSTSVVF